MIGVSTILLYGREAPTRLLQGREGTYCFIETCYVAVW